VDYSAISVNIRDESGTGRAWTNIYTCSAYNSTAAFKSSVEGFGLFSLLVVEGSYV
jgi:hypothetical protein